VPPLDDGALARPPRVQLHGPSGGVRQKGPGFLPEGLEDVAEARAQRQDVHPHRVRLEPLQTVTREVPEANKASDLSTAEHGHAAPRVRRRRSLVRSPARGAADPRTAAVLEDIVSHAQGESTAFAAPLLRFAPHVRLTGPG
jgi:hypothetical protein